MDSTAPTKVTITYCTQCNWLLRASWMAGELLQTFAAEVDEVALRPGTGGIFRITATGPGAGSSAAKADGSSDAGSKTAITGGSGDPGDPGERPVPDDGSALVWDRKSDGGFPDIVDLKRRVRDVIAPELVLGHADRAAAKADQDS